MSCKRCGTEYTNNGYCPDCVEVAELNSKLDDAEAKVKELGEQIKYYRWLNKSLEIDNKLLASDAGQNPFDPQKNYYIEMVAFRERLAEAEAKIDRAVRRIDSKDLSQSRALVLARKELSKGGM